MSLALCGGMMTTARTASDTAEQIFAPIPRATAAIALQRRQQEAQVTATYIAVLGSQVISDTKKTHGLQRDRQQEEHDRDQALAETWTTVKRFGAWTMATSLSIMCVGIAVRFGAAWAMDGVHSARKAVMPLPQLSRPLSDGVHLLADGRATDTRTLASWSVMHDLNPSPEQARAMVEIRAAVYGEIARALVPMLSAGQMTREVVER